MKKNIYILTQVVDRCIATEVFDTWEEAAESMQRLFSNALEQENLTEEDSDHYEMGKNGAWINSYHDTEYDWGIVRKEVTV